MTIFTQDIFLAENLDIDTTFEYLHYITPNMK